MENNGEAVEDDQGSGWLEVKKRHRSSSKFSLQGWVGGSSGKSTSKILHNHPLENKKVANSHAKNKSTLQKAGDDFRDKIPVLNDKDARYHDKHIANEDDKSTTPPLSGIMKATTQNSTTQGIEDVSQKDIRVKIKWGNIDDDALVSRCEKTVGGEIKFGNIGNDNYIISNPSLSTEVPEIKSTNKIVSENDEVQLEGDKMVDEHDDVLHSEEKRGLAVDEIENVSNCKEIHDEHANPVEGEKLLIIEKDYEPNESEVGDLNNSEEPTTVEVPTVISQTTELLAEDNSLKTHAESSMKTSNDDMSKEKMVFDVVDSVGDAGESKERFRQRLWCFLFENLNRAVDELYLLCELECDLEQVKEAILVLEEAAYDFKELKSRVHEFDNVKKSSSLSLDGMPVTPKNDHQRPHALSWEVRRMTTSPQRAEILSSSLEAFKKIQHERASVTKPPTIARTLRPNGAMKSVVKDAGIMTSIAKDSDMKSSIKQSGGADSNRGKLSGDKRKVESNKSGKSSLVQHSNVRPQKSSVLDPSPSRSSLNECSSSSSGPGKSKIEQSGLSDSTSEKNPRFMDHLKKQMLKSENEKEKEKINASSWNSMNAWKEKRNWEDILASPFRASSRVSHSPGMSRKSVERSRMLRDKLMSPEKKKKNSLDLKKEAENKHARAMRIRGELENERVQKLQRTSEKLSRVNEWQAVRSMKLREGMESRHQQSISRHEAYLAQVVRRAGDESSKVNEVRFITSLNEESKKFMLRQKHHESELRRAEKIQVMKSKQREEMAREEAVLERRKLIEAEKLQRLAETQRKKEEAQVRWEEERKLSSAAREAKAIEQLRRKESRKKARQEEAELLAQKLAERLSESEQRRKFYLEQIRERASMDFRDQSSPLLRRASNKEGQVTCVNSTSEGSTTQANGNIALQQSLKRRIKRIRQRLMALKYEFSEIPINNENTGIGYRTAVGTARAKIGRWLQELQKLRQARKEGAASIGLITAEMIKFLEGREPELHASRQAGLLDFIASALPASHTSKPKACHVTIYLLRLVRVVLSLPANRSYFLSQNLLPPIIPILSAALENYIKIAASVNLSGSTNSLLSKTTVENFESISEILDEFLRTVSTVIGHVNSDERQLQMQDGLLELVVAYQVIHRLRDLFALYDRPQVEGSPFPSSIILSINMLIVLTSKPRTVSSIDWELFSIEAEKIKDCQEPFTVLHLPDVPEGRALDIMCETNQGDVSGSCENVLTGVTIESNDDNHDKAPKPQKDEKNALDCGVKVEQNNENISALKQPLELLLLAISETGLVSLPSLLTAVLLKANNRLSSEQASYVLPSNFEEVAAGVLKVLNNLALIDIHLMQKMLARPDLKMEFFHLMSFLLSHCTSKWKVASDQVGLLLLESLLLLSYFSLFHPGNQAVLRWGKSPTILHKVCDLPFVFFSDLDLMPILAGTLVAACYGCEQNKDVVQQELSVDMLLSLLTSCKNTLPTPQSNSTRDKSPEESKKNQTDSPLKLNRSKNTKVSSGKGISVNNSKISKTSNKNQKESKGAKGSEDLCLKWNQPGLEGFSSNLTLHGRFPRSFVDKAEQFFSATRPDPSDEA